MDEARPLPSDVVDQLADRMYLPGGDSGSELPIPRCGWRGSPPTYVCRRDPGHPLPHVLVHVPPPPPNPAQWCAQPGCTRHAFDITAPYHEGSHG